MSNNHVKDMNEFERLVSSFCSPQYKTQFRLCYGNSHTIDPDKEIF